MGTLGGGTGSRVAGILGWSLAKDGLVRLKRMSRMERVGCDHFAGGAVGTDTVDEGFGGGMDVGDPVCEEVSKFQDRGELLVVDCGWGVFDHTREEVQGVDDMVALGYCGLDEVVVEKHNGDGVAKGFGDAIHNEEAAVVVEGGTDVEALVAAEVP